MKGAGLVAYAKTLFKDLADTPELLADLDLSLDRFHRSGAFGRASERRSRAITALLRERYLEDPELRRALAILARSALELPALDLILGYHAALTDPLLFDFAADFLQPLRASGQRKTGVPETVAFLESLGLVGEGRWSGATASEVARKLLAACRDFGLLEGLARKQITGREVPLPAFVWVAYLRSREAPGLELLVADRHFRVLLLEQGEVDALLRRADARGLARYQGGGVVGRVDFPFDDLGALARALA